MLSFDVLMLEFWLEDLEEIGEHGAGHAKSKKKTKNGRRSCHDMLPDARLPEGFEMAPVPSRRSRPLEMDNVRYTIFRIVESSTK